MHEKILRLFVEEPNKSINLQQVGLGDTTTWHF